MMPAIRYRSIKTPPACGSISLKDAEKSAKTVARSAVTGRFVAAKTNGDLATKTIVDSALTHGRKTSSGAVGTSKKSTSKSKSTHKSVARKR